MQAISVNRSEIGGPLARPPQYFEIGNYAVCRLRIKFIGSGEPKLFNVIALGDLAEACYQVLDEGDTVRVDGSLTWHKREQGEVHGEEGYEFHEYVAIVADCVQLRGVDNNLVPLKAGSANRVSFDQAPADVQALIMERVVELTELDRQIPCPAGQG